MSATETEEATDTSDETGTEPSVEPTAKVSEPTEVPEASVDTPVDEEVSDAADQAQADEVTMLPPDRVEELFELASKSLDRLDEASVSVKSLADSQQQAVEQSGELAPAFKKAMEEAAAEALENGGEALTKQVEEAAAETTKALEASLVSSQQAVEQMEAAGASFKVQAWRNSLFASLAAACIGLIAVLLAGWLMTWWVRGDVDAMREERRELVSEIRTLKETADDWASRFGRADVSTCEIPGEGEQPCVRIDVDAGTFRGEKGEHYRVLWGN